MRDDCAPGGTGVAHDEAQTLIRDATHQAMLVAAAAEQAAETVLAEARSEAEQERDQAHLTATAFRAQAEQSLLGAQREADQRHADLAADLTRSWNEHERELRELLAVAQADAADVRTAADEQAAGLLDEARRQAALLLDVVEERLDRAERDRWRRRLRPPNGRQPYSMRPGPGRPANWPPPSEQTAWARQTLTGLVETAHLEAARIRGQAHAEAARIRGQRIPRPPRWSARTRLRLSGVLASASREPAPAAAANWSVSMQAAAESRERRLAEASAEATASWHRHATRPTAVLARGRRVRRRPPRPRRAAAGRGRGRRPRGPRAGG